MEKATSWVKNVGKSINQQKLTRWICSLWEILFEDVTFFPFRRLLSTY